VLAGPDDEKARAKLNDLTEAVVNGGRLGPVRLHDARDQLFEH
jgi:hypothetical protein